MPACVKPGVFELGVPVATTWKLDDGFAHGLPCSEWSPTTTKVRINVVGTEVYVSELGSNDQPGSANGEVTRDGDCAIHLAYHLQDLEIVGARLVFAGDQLTGTADTVTRSRMAINGAGDEAMSTCQAHGVPLIGTRLRD